MVASEARFMNAFVFPTSVQSAIHIYKVDIAIYYK
jgi:hypothetical protein